MCKIYDITYECGCMETSDQENPGFMPCESGYWDMTPEEFRSPNPPDNYSVHTKCMTECYRKQYPIQQ